MAKKATRRDLKAAKGYVKTFTKAVKAGKGAKAATQAAEKFAANKQNWSNFDSTVTGNKPKKRR